MLANPSQLIMRNLAELAPGRLLLINPPADDLCLELRGHSRATDIVLFSQDYSDHLAHQRQEGPELHARFGATLTDQAPFDQVILFLARERQKTRMLLEWVRDIVTNDARLWLVGEKRAGIKTSSRFMSEDPEAIEKLDAARHCMLFGSRVKASDEPFALDPWLIKTRLDDDLHNLRIVSLPGVFSHGELDTGTRLLLENLQLPNQGRVLDFGCGCGVVGRWIKSQQPALDLVLADSNALALAASTETLRANGLQGGIEVTASDVYSDIEGDFDLIVSNPPFHKGVSTHYSATEKFLQESALRLRRHGQMIIVANHFLRYLPLLERVFGKVDTLASASGFRVYRCRQN
jgi:16S rRNA (guanine1207-N2)-methyltransferase